MVKVEPKEGEYWWAWPPDGGGPEPVQIIELSPTGNHALSIMGRSDFGHARQWTLERPITGRPKL